LPPEPGQPERVDYEYERRGTANVFMVFEPLAEISHTTMNTQGWMAMHEEKVKKSDLSRGQSPFGVHRRAFQGELLPQ
jgi:hypothetical protein